MYLTAFVPVPYPRNTTVGFSAWAWRTPSLSQHPHRCATPLTTAITLDQPDDRMGAQEMITNDLALTHRRIQHLNMYMTTSVLADDRFLCRHFSECRASHTGNFYEGQLHHVGKAYDLLIDGWPLRIVVVGQAYGGPPPKVTLEERYRAVLVETGENRRFGKDGSGLLARNPHMRGTTSLLRLLFGIPLGTDHESEYIKTDDGRGYHIFDAFALVNYLLCSAVSSAGGTTDMSTRTMHQNCRGHFRQTLEILEPTVVAVQGIGFWPLVKRSLEVVEPIDENGLMYRAQLGRRTFLTAAFSHPSARDARYGWGANAHSLTCWRQLCQPSSASENCC